MKPCFREGKHHLSPTVRKLGETVKEKDTGPSIVTEACLQDMHLEAVAVVHHPGSNSTWQRARTVCNIGIVRQPNAGVGLGSTRRRGKRGLQHDCRRGLQELATRAG
jgi:hypothetical protein